MTVNVYEVYEDILDQINKKHLTNYKLGTPLGEGKFVKVFEIFGYKDDDEYVGRFTLKPTTEDSWEWIKTKTEQEYKLLTQRGIQEKYVGKLCKTYQSEDWYFSIQKKYITLPNYLRNELGKNPDNKKKELIFSKILYELSDALFYIHNFDYENSKGILLRDVKPENIMYDPRIDRCILCDFNIAREYNPKEYWAGTTMMVGTPEYMAPEIVAVGGTEKYPNPRQDIYSLGATLFTLTTRKSLKEEVDDSVYKYQEISDDQKFNALRKSGLSKEFQNIIYCSIQADPEKRYQEADELFTYVSSLYHSRYFETKYEETLEELKEKKLRNKELVAQISSMNSNSTKKEKTTKKTLLEADNKIQELNKSNSELKSELLSLEKKYEREKKLSSEYRDKYAKLVNKLNAEKVHLESSEKFVLVGFILCTIATIAALILSIFGSIVLTTKISAYIPLLSGVPLIYYLLFYAKWTPRYTISVVILSLVYSALEWISLARIPGTYYYAESLAYIIWAILIAIVSKEFSIVLKSKMKHINIPLACIFIMLILSVLFSLGILSTNMDAAVGKHITLGTYEQDGDEYNGEEDLTWTIESKVQNDFLVLSCDKCIEYKPFNDEVQEDLEWKDSTIKAWLDSEFLNSFSKEEYDVLAYRTTNYDEDEFVILNYPDQINLLNKMPMPSEYAELKRDDLQVNKTETPLAFTNTRYKNYKGTSLIKAVSPGQSKITYIPCTSYCYIRPIILVSKTNLDKYMMNKEG